MARQPLLTPEETAEYLSVSVKTLYSWRSKGEGPPAVRVGKYLRFAPADLDAWLDDQPREVRRPA